MLFYSIPESLVITRIRTQPYFFKTSTNEVEESSIFCNSLPSNSLSLPIFIITTPYL